MHSAQHQQSGRISRRKFLRALGMGAVALGTSSVLPGHAQQRVSIPEEVFGRMFPDLPAFFAHLHLRRDSDFEPLRKAMREIGKLGGIMDAGDVIDTTPPLEQNDPLLEEKLRQLSIDLITNSDLSANNPNNPAMTAGTTFMGQFLDHDMTFDLASKLGVPTDPEDSVNSRTPSLDLDSVYGGGPSGSPSLYERGGRGPKLNIDTPKTDSRLLFEDLPRSSNGTAIIADPRNDENLIIAGLQAAFILFHNNAVDYVMKEDREFRNSSSDDIFREARRLTRWHYQWMIVHEFLPLFIGQSLVNDILAPRGRKFYQPREAFIPVEFQGAVYRFGHTLVRPSYRANLAGDRLPKPNGPTRPFFGMVFNPAGQGQADPLDLRGGARAPRRFIGWQTFFDFGPNFKDPGASTPAIKPNKLVDTKISTPLFSLPLAAIASGDPPISLPQRNLLRHITWSLPSGQSIAKELNELRELKVPILSKGDLSDLKQFGLGLDEHTPLWFYILREGRIHGTEGRHLGPVGGRIVGEVFIGALQLDSRSYLGADPRWKPTLPDRSGKVTGNFKMIDFLTFAGVAPDPGQRGQ